MPLRQGRPRQPGGRRDRGARGAAPPEPARLLGEAGLQDPVHGGRGVGARAARHRRRRAKRSASSSRTALKFLLATPDRPRLKGRPFPWAGVFSDGRRADDVDLADPRDDATVRVDFRFLVREERTESTWVRRATRRRSTTGSSGSAATASRSSEQRARALPLAGDGREVQAAPRVADPRPQAPAPAGGEPRRGPREASSGTPSRRRGWPGGSTSAAAASRPQDQGASFAVALHAAANRVLPDLYPALRRDRRSRRRAAAARRARALRPVAQVPHGRPRHPRARLRHATSPRAAASWSRARPGAHRVRGRPQRDGAARPLRRPALRLHRRTS